MAKPRYFCAFVALMAAATTAEAVVIEFTDKAEWVSAVGVFSTIHFTEFPDNTFLFDQYEELGVLFTDGDDNIACCSDDGFPNDGSGLDGNLAIHLLFTSPQRWIAADFPGALRIQLFSEGDLIYTSSNFGSIGVGHFAGLISSELFDEAILIDWVDEDSVALDDLHFGFLPLGDLDGDGQVGVTDLLSLLGAWGPCPEPCPPTCLGDIDSDCTVGVTDLLELLAAWGPNPGHPADFDGDGIVGVLDLLALLGALGPCPPPIPCLADLDFDGIVGVTDLLILLGNWTA